MTVKSRGSFSTLQASALTPSSGSVRTVGRSAAAGRRLTRRLVVPLVALVGLALASSACSKCGSSGAGADAQVVEAPVPAPQGLLADVYVPSPNTFWSKMQRGVGGAVGILPTSAGGILAMGLGLDATVGEEIDGTLPAFGVVAGAADNPAWAFAMKLTELRHARSVLFDGDTARFQAKEHDGLTEIVAKGGAAPVSYGLAMTKSGYVVIARTPSDLPTLAPYLTRTLPARPVPAGSIVCDVPHEAVASRLAPKLTSLWDGVKAGLLEKAAREQEAHGGRAADFGDPKAIVGVIDATFTKSFDVAKDLERVRFAFDVDDGGAVVTATLTPAQGGGPASKWIAAMKTGDAAPLAALPVESAVALLSRDGDDERAAQAQRFEQAVAALLGPRLGEPDAKALHAAIESAAKARGEALSAAVLWDGPDGFVVRASGDVQAGRDAVGKFVEMARGPAVRDALRLRDVVTKTDDVEGLGKVQTASFFTKPDEATAHAGAKAMPAAFDKAPQASGATGATPLFSVAWAESGQGFFVAAGKDPMAPLREVTKPERTLGGDPAVKTVLAPLGNDASVIVLAQPLKFEPKRANLPMAPVVFALGRHGQEAFLRYHVSNGILREVSRRFMGL